MIVEPLGSGGGGAVYAAYDAHLGRRVAIKVLATRAESSESTWGRVIAEAQLVARLDHPNVVTVHDVGVADDRAFIAMELVDGADLDSWLSKQRAGSHNSGWRGLIEPMLLAGKGLAAAHERHVIHGDFKPANVLVGKDGRVRVTDFGVARMKNPRPAVDPGRTHSIDGDISEWMSTATDEATPGKLWGTPLYMAPELFDGQRPDEASDIYSFCASIYHALYGQPPAQGRNLMALYAAKVEAPQAPRTGSVPRRVRDVLLQGLDPEPSRRPGSVASIVAILDKTTHARHRAYAWTAGAVGISAGFALLGFLSWDREASCEHAEEHMAGIWDDSARDAVRESMLATDLPYAQDTWSRVERQLDAYVGSWVGLHTEACLATKRGEQSAELLDRKMTCLAERKVELAALVEVLRDADADVVENALDAAVSLSEASDCQDFEALHQGVASDSVEAGFNDSIARARTLIHAGRGDEAFALLDDTRRQAIETGAMRPAVNAMRWMGEIESDRGHPDEALALLEEATVTAGVEKVDDIAADAAIALARTYITDVGQPKKTREWMPHVDVAVRRSRPGPEMRFRFFHVRGMMYKELGEWDEALADWGRAKELLDELPDPRPFRSDLMNAYGLLYSDRGQWEQAEGYLERALKMKREVYGPQHPTVAQVLDNLGTVVTSRGDYERALSIDAEALGIIEGAYGPDHPIAITIETNRAGVYAEMGQLGEAERTYRRVIAAYDRIYSEDHVYSAAARMNLAAVLGRNGNYEDSLEVSLRALPVVESTYGDKHPWVGFALTNVGTAQKHLGKSEAAIENLERALEVLKDQPADSVQIAKAKMALAEALVDAGREKTRAIALARGALDVFDPNSGDAQRAREWLAQR